MDLGEFYSEVNNMETSEMITELHSTLKNWVGGHLIIEKDEHGDQDKVIMLLEDLSFLHRGEIIDDYTASTLLQLHGKGKVISDEATVPLPHSNFEIQLEDMKNINQEDKHLTISTDRANYSITYNPN